MLLGYSVWRLKSINFLLCQLPCRLLLPPAVGLWPLAARSLTNDFNPNAWMTCPWNIVPHPHNSTPTPKRVEVSFNWPTILNIICVVTSMGDKKIIEHEWSHISIHLLINLEGLFGLTLYQNICYEICSEDLIWSWLSENWIRVRETFELNQLKSTPSQLLPVFWDLTGCKLVAIHFNQPISYNFFSNAS